MALYLSMTLQTYFTFLTPQSSSGLKYFFLDFKVKGNHETSIFSKKSDQYFINFESCKIFNFNKQTMIVPTKNENVRRLIISVNLKDLFITYF